MYDDLNSLSRQLKMDNFSFLEIEETTQSKDEQPLSNMAIKQELPLPEKIEVVSESTTQPSQPNQMSLTQQLMSFLISLIIKIITTIIQRTQLLIRSNLLY